MNAETVYRINKAAQLLVDMVGAEVPIDATTIVQKLGGRVEKNKKLSAGDVLVGKLTNGKFRIRISSYAQKSRSDILIIKGLGHLILHMGLLTDPEMWDEQEPNALMEFRRDEEIWQAYEFARDFLMPEKQFMEQVDAHTDVGRVNCARVAEYFNLPVGAVILRGKSLGIFSSEV